MIEIHKNIYAIETALYLKKHKTIILADLHFGFEENLKNQGVLVPKQQYKLIIEQLKRIISKVDAEKIVLNGDIKHEFGRITKQEKEEVNKFLDFCSKNFKEIIVIKGNHDPILKFLINKKNINEITECIVGNILITHGDLVPKKLKKIILTGHEHPAIILESESKKEKYKCFVKGKFKDSVLIVQPCFNPLVEGSDIKKKKKFGPFLPEDLNDFEIFIYDESREKVLYFGKLKNIIN